MDKPSNINKLKLCKIYMKIGGFYVPDKRFGRTVLSDLKLIYDNRQMEYTKSSYLSVLFGYKYRTATMFYHRLNSLVSFGLLEGHGIFRITTLGQKILFPENEEDDKVNKSTAILNVPLWKELYRKFQKQLPDDNLWHDLKNIAYVNSDITAKKESTIRKWYDEDIAYVSDEVLQSNEKQNTEILRSSNAENQLVSQQTIPQYMEVISFDNYQVILPKRNLKKEWEKLKKYMNIKLEDYEYKETLPND